ncbi:MAG: hypothetical protein KDE09_11570, partial [Anaerolineales bacterium]|nr:hypothetical protein [Anaerolineales bacterium]
ATMIAFNDAVKTIREAWINVQAGLYAAPLEPAVAESDKQEVLRRYQPIFTPDHLPRLTEAEFRSFLIFSNNKHWSGLHRLGPRICKDMMSPSVVKVPKTPA